MNTRQDLQTILIQFTYAGVLGTLTQNHYVLWDGKGFPIALAGNELKRVIHGELQKHGLHLKVSGGLYA